MSKVGKGGIVRPYVPNRNTVQGSITPSPTPSTGIQSPGVMGAARPGAFAPAWAGSQYRGVPNRGMNNLSNDMLYNPRNRHGVV